MHLKTLSLASLLCLNCVVQAAVGNERVETVLQKVASHSFHPLNDDHSFTNDRKVGKHGTADLDDTDWRVRSLAIRNLLLELPNDALAVQQGLDHKNHHVRQIVAAALAIGGDQASVSKLERLRLSTKPSLKSWL